MEVSIEEAGPPLDELIDMVLAGGGEVVLTRDGRPVARLLLVVDHGRQEGQDDKGDFNGPL